MKWHLQPLSGPVSSHRHFPSYFVYLTKTKYIGKVLFSDLKIYQILFITSSGLDIYCKSRRYRPPLLGVAPMRFCDATCRNRISHEPRAIGKCSFALCQRDIAIHLGL